MSRNRLAAWTLLYLLLPASASFRAQGAQDDLVRGQQLAQAGRFEEALLAFDRFKQSHLRDVRPYLYSATAMAEAGHLKDANLELDQAYALHPTNPKLLLAYARGREKLGQLEEASRSLAGLKGDRRLGPEGLWFLADLYYRQRKAKEALQVLDSFAALRPKDPRIHLRRGQILIYLEKFEEALTSLEEAVWADPGNAPAHFEMARTLRYGNNLEAAKKVALKAVELDADHAATLHLLGIICAGLEQYEEAITYLERAAGLKDAFSRIYFDLGNALRKTGNSAKARKVLEKYRGLLNGEQKEVNRLRTVGGLINQGQLQIRDGAIGQARASFMRVLEVDPENWLANNFLAKIYISSGRPQLAREHLNKMQKIDPNSSEGNYLAAYYWYELKNESKALTYAEKSKRLRPGDADLRNLLGNLYSGIGRTRQALAEYSAAVKLAPERTDFRANYAALARKVKP